MKHTFQPQQPQIKTRTAVLVFIKGAAAPLVLYFENTQAVYQELLEAIRSQSARLIEKEPLGPIKRVALISNQISAVALQEEQYT